MSVTNVMGYDYHYFILHIALPVFEVSTQKMIYTHVVNVHDKRYYTNCTDCYLNFNTKNDVDTHMVNIYMVKRYFTVSLLNTLRISFHRLLKL